MGFHVQAGRARTSVREAIARVDLLEADLNAFKLGSLAFLAGCDELVTELGQILADARDLAALAHAEAGRRQTDEGPRPYLRGALERWAA